MIKKHYNVIVWPLVLPTLLVSLVAGCGRSGGFRSAEVPNPASDEPSLSSASDASAEGTMALSFGSDILTQPDDKLVVEVIDSKKTVHRQIATKTDRPTMNVRFNSLSPGNSKVTVKVEGASGATLLEGAAEAYIERGKASQVTISLRETNDTGSLVVVIRKAPDAGPVAATAAPTMTPTPPQQPRQDGALPPTASASPATPSPGATPSASPAVAISCSIPPGSSSSFSMDPLMNTMVCTGKILASGSMNNSDLRDVAAAHCNRANTSRVGSCCAMELFGEGRWFLTDGAVAKEVGVTGDITSWGRSAGACKK